MNLHVVLYVLIGFSPIPHPSKILAPARGRQDEDRERWRGEADVHARVLERPLSQKRRIPSVRTIGGARASVEDSCS